VRLRALFTTAVIVLTLLRGAPSASADDNTGKRDQTKARQAQVQGQLNLALASDATVETQLNTLNAQVVSQQNRLDDARRTQVAAAAQVTSASRQLADVGGRVDRTRQQLRTVALRAYMQPYQNLVSGGVFDVNEVVLGQELLRVASANQSDALDGFRQAQRDLTAAKATMQSALDVAKTRSQVAADQAARLTAAQRAQQAAHAELQKRIVDLRKESTDLAAQESGIEALIARAQAARSAAVASVPSAGSAGPGSAGSAGLTVSGAGLIWPIHGPVTSEFGPRWGGFHPGIDIAPPYGTPIAAAKNGVVIFAGPEGGYGNFVLIDHGGGLVTGYAHQSRLAVNQGQTVTQGQVIGYEGSTGDSTGPHLHFEVRINGSPQNPRSYEAGGP